LRYATTHTTNSLTAFSAYRFHFNGQEADNEVAGSGNSYTAEFWQYDPRLGRRFNIDPKPNPTISVYACFANNPIVFTDPNGDTVKYNSLRDRVYVGITRLFNKQFNKDFKQLKKSEEAYIFKGSSQLENQKTDVDGVFGTDGKVLFINYKWNSRDNSIGDGKRNSLLHETEHAIQFEYGEIGFKFNQLKNKWDPIFYDISDELKAFQKGSFAPGSYPFDGKQNTFNGEMRTIALGLENETNLKNSAAKFLKYFPPDDDYHKLKKEILNSNYTYRIQTDRLFVRPYKSRSL
jgi:RHS repeat-associated protein